MCKYNMNFNISFFISFKENDKVISFEDIDNLGVASVVSHADIIPIIGTVSG